MLHLALALPLLAAPTPQDWPQFKGPDRNACLPALDTDYQWADAGPDVVWRVETGRGYGGVAAHGGEVVLLDRDVGGGEDILRVLSLRDGKELWRVAYDAPGRLQFPGSRNVPAVTAEHVVTVGGLGHVSGFSRKDKKLLWQVDVAEEFGGELPMFGWSGAPLLHGDQVIVTVLGDDVGLAAIDVATGETRWASQGLGTSHSTPTLMRLLGRDHVVFLSTTYQASGRDEAAQTTLTGLDPANGEILWQTETLLTRLPIPGPVPIDEQRFLITGGYKGGTSLMRIREEDGATTVEALFHVERGSQTHAPVVHGEHVYLLANENWNYNRRREEGGLMCLGLDGKERWRTGADPYFGRGGMLLAGDHLLIQDGFDGTLHVVEANADGFKPVAQADVFGEENYGSRDETMWAPLAVSNGLLLMRSHQELLCVRP